MGDLRQLAQAVVDAQKRLLECERASPRDDWARHGADMALLRAEQALTNACTQQGSIVGELDAIEAQGYAQAIEHASDVAYGIAVSRHQHDIPSASTLHYVSGAIKKLALDRPPAGQSGPAAGTSDQNETEASDE